MNINAYAPNLIGLGVEQIDLRAASVDDPAIRRQATELEGVFMSMLVKELRQTTEGNLFGDESTDSLGSLFDLYIGQHLAESKPLGIADLWLDHYRKNAIPSADSRITQAPTEATYSNSAWRYS
jgi:Rod binding domain-containing protein